MAIDSHSGISANAARRQQHKIVHIAKGFHTNFTNIENMTVTTTTRASTGIMSDFSLLCFYMCYACLYATATNIDCETISFNYFVLPHAVAFRTVVILTLSRDRTLWITRRKEKQWKIVIFWKKRGLPSAARDMHNNDFVSRTIAATMTTMKTSMNCFWCDRLRCLFLEYYMSNLIKRMYSESNKIINVCDIRIISFVNDLSDNCLQQGNHKSTMVFVTVTWCF